MWALVQECVNVAFIVLLVHASWAQPAIHVALATLLAAAWAPIGRTPAGQQASAALAVVAVNVAEIVFAVRCVWRIYCWERTIESLRSWLTTWWITPPSQPVPASAPNQPSAPLDCVQAALESVAHTIEDAVRHKTLVEPAAAAAPALSCQSLEPSSVLSTSTLDVHQLTLYNLPQDIALATHQMETTVQHAIHAL